MDLYLLAKEIIAGRRIKRGEALDFFVTGNLQELQKGADLLREHFCGRQVDLCTIINGRSGRCGEDCKYCAQSAYYATGVEEYEFLKIDAIVENALANENEGVDRFAIVTSGRSLNDNDFEKALHAYVKLNNKCKISLCASHGLLTAEQFKRLHKAGVESYHENIETSKRYFPYICTTHTYEEKIATIKAARKEGLCVCSGGIIGMGETWEDRLDMAISLAELGIESIPLNALMPIKGTPLEKQTLISAEDILRTIAFFRYINPAANIRLGAGRKILPGNGAVAFKFGASATITGNMLTTSGADIKADKKMLRELGFNIKG